MLFIKITIDISSHEKNEKKKLLSLTELQQKKKIFIFFCY